MEKVNLLFTSGWDSTFRFLQLCQYEIEIQPIYIIDRERRSNTIEQSQIAKIIKEAKKRFKATINDVIFYEWNWILETCANESISNAFDILHSKYNIGTQYRIFALLTHYLGDEKYECAVVHQYHGKVEDAIVGEGKLGIIEAGIIPERYCVESVDGDDNVYKVFCNIIFPVIKLTKKDEEQIARENGWMDIMQLTWFCFAPIKGKPCGLCSPCDDAMNTGMEWRMPAISRWRYHNKKILFACRKCKRIVVKTFNKIARRDENKSKPL